MKTKQLLLLLLLWMTPCLMAAQKKELSQARSYIKSGKDFDKAEKLMTDLLLKDSASRENPRVYQTWAEAVRKQYEAANERLYLHQNQDTAAFFALTRRMFTVLVALDSVEMRHLRKGKTMPESRQKSQQELMGHRPNLFAGGSFLVKKNKWPLAYDYFETYINCRRQPLFENVDLQTDPRLPDAAYWATYSAYKMNDAERVLRFKDLALADSTKASYVLQYVADAYQWKGDTTHYAATLEEGFRRFPIFPYFFPRLYDYYSQNGDYELALQAADRALKYDDANQLYLFSRLVALYMLKCYDECIATADRMISLDETFAEAYYYAGSAYLNSVMSIDERRNRSKAKDLYQKSRVYMEYYRSLMPGEAAKWAPPLYQVYLNLNMGRQFDEIDQILKKLK